MTESKARQKAHYYFDQIWQERGMTRDECYEGLSKLMGLSREECHISKLSGAQCLQVVEYSVNLLNDLRRLDLDFGTTDHEHIELPAYVTV